MSSLNKLSRRKFLTAGGVAVAGSALATSGAQAQKMDHSKHNMADAAASKKLPLAPASGYATPKEIGRAHV